MSGATMNETDLIAERERVNRVRSTAESSNTPPNPEDYVIIDGKYRVVKPYHFDFVFGVKQRHNGKSIVDIFSQEFPGRTREYYEHAALIGALHVENRPNVGPNTPLTAGYRMRNLVHRHEPPVLANPITIVGETSQYVAVNKPPCMPVHVAGQYRKNTVLGILNADHPELGNLHPVHRLDKPVSGVLIFARNAAAADTLRQGIADKGSVSKIYIARVAGKFPRTVVQPDDSVRDGSTRMNVVVHGTSDEEERTGGLRNYNEPIGEVIVADAGLSWDPRANHAMAIPLERNAQGEVEDSTTAPITLQGEQISLEENKREGNAVLGAAPTDVGGPAEVKTQEVSAGDGDADGTSPKDVIESGKKMEDQSRKQIQGDEDLEVDEEGREIGGPRKKRKLKKISALQKADRMAALKAAAEASIASGPQVRPAVTEFRLIAVAPDGKTSLVQCRPLTGRTHQIRAHLAYLGHPIANDVQYGGQYDGPSSCRALAEHLGVSWSAGGKDGGPGGFGVMNKPQNGDLTTRNSANVVNGDVGRAEALKRVSLCPDFEAPAEFHDPVCPHCPLYGPIDHPNDLRPLWLHARKYACPEWSFEAPVPEWAEMAWIPELPAEGRVTAAMEK